MPGTKTTTSLSFKEVTIDSPSRSPARALRAPSSHQSPSGPQGGLPPNVSIRSDPSGGVHVTVKVTEPRPHKLKCKRNQSFSFDSTCYLDPPENITPSQKRLIDAKMIQVNKESLIAELKSYINQLMSMSRASIDQLSDQSDFVSPTRNSPEQQVEQYILTLSGLTEEYADKVNTLVDLFDQIEPYGSLVAAESPPAYQTPSPRMREVPPIAPQTSRLPRPARTVPTPLPFPKYIGCTFQPPAGRRGPSPTGRTPTRGPSPAGSTPSIGPSPAGRTPRRGPGPPPAGSTLSRGPYPTGRTPSRPPSPAVRVPLRPITPPMFRRPVGRPATPIPTKVVGPHPGLCS